MCTFEKVVVVNILKHFAFDNNVNVFKFECFHSCYCISLSKRLKVYNQLLDPLATKCKYKNMPPHLKSFLLTFVSAPEALVCERGTSCIQEMPECF